MKAFLQSFAVHMRKHFLFSGLWFFAGGWYLPVLMSKLQADAWTRPDNYMIVVFGLLLILASVVGFRLHKQAADTPQ